MLTYYLKESDAGQKPPLKDAIYRLSGCELVQNNKVANAFSIVPQTLQSGPKTLKLRCESEDEMAAWTDTLLGNLRGFWALFTPVGPAWLVCSFLYPRLPPTPSYNS